MNKAKNIAVMTIALIVAVAFAGDSAPFFLKTAKGTRIARETEAIAYSTAWNNGSSVRVTADGITLKEAVAPASGDVMWNAAKAGVGGHTLTHVSGGETLTAKFAVLGDNVVVHSGTLGSSETWEADKVHLVTAPLTVPSGMSLVIETGAVVKFMSETSLTVESGGVCTAKGVVFTHVNDDTVGGDTLMDGDAEQPNMGDYTLTGNVIDDYATEYRYLPPQTLTSSISSNTKLRGYQTYIVSNSVTVASGVTLTLQPGAVLKFSAGCSLAVNGTLDAQGSRAAPIVFTSLKDDEHGGDTNGDGDKTYAQGGDWYQIRVAGAANFNYCHVLYNSSTENYGGVEAYGGTINFDNSEIAHTKYECVNAHSSGNFVARNSIFRDSSLGFGYYGSGRVKAYNCVFSDLSTAIRQSGKTLVNCVFYRCVKFTDQSGDRSSYSHCVFFNDSGYGAQSYAKCGSNGNIWGDPLFADPENGDFRITGNSPCIDAGDGTAAPEKDYYGTPRMNVDGVRPTGVAAANGAVPDIGIYEVPGNGDIPSADLAVTDVCAPDALTIGQTVRISWKVKNIGEMDASGQWRDIVEIVTANGQILDLGEHIATLDVRVGKTQTFTGDFTVPCGTEGPCSVRVTSNGYRDLFEGGRMENNVLTASTKSQLVVGERDLPTDGSEVAIVVAPGKQTAFSFDTLNGRAGLVAIRCENDLSAWLGNGSVATKGNAVRTAVQVATDLWLLEIPAGTEPRVSVSNDGLEPSSIGFSLAAGDFMLCDIGRITSLNTGTVTVPFAGIGFTDGIRCYLALNGSKKVEASEIMIHDSVSASAVSDVNGFTPGVYSIVVQKGEEEDSVEALELIRAQDAAARWNCSLDLAETTRANRTYIGRFEYENLGDAPMAVPYVTLQSSGGTLIRLSESDAWTDSIDVLAISSTYPASSLKPGETGEIKFYYRSSGERATVTFKCAGGKRVVDENGQFFKVGIAQPMQNGVVIYQDAHKKIIRYTIVTYKSHIDEPNDIRTSADNLRPSNVDKLPWSFAHPKLADAFGDTWKTYIARLA